MSVDQIRTIVSTLARSDGLGVIRRLPLMLMVLRMLPVPWHSAPCSHAMAVGDWLSCTRMDWTLLRIFFWWPARVTPILSKSLGERKLKCIKIFGNNSFNEFQISNDFHHIDGRGRSGSEPFHRAKHPSFHVISCHMKAQFQTEIGGAQNTQIHQINLSHLRKDLLCTLLCIAKTLR